MTVRPWTTRLSSFVPEWLARRPGLEWAFKFLWAIAFMVDRGAQVSLEGMRAGWPGYDARTDNFPLLGQSRGLVMGEEESASSFGRRLRSWLTLAQDLGGDGGLVLALHFWLATSPMVRLWSRNGKCTTCCAGSFTLTTGSTSVTASSSQTTILLAGDSVVFQPGPTTPFTIASVSGTSIVLELPWTGGNFATAACVVRRAGIMGGWSGAGALSGYGLNWDSLSNPERAEWWWETWLVIYSTEFGSSGTLGARSTGYNSPAAEQSATGQYYGIGHLCTRVQYDTIRGLVQTWKGQHATVRWIVWCSDSTLFDPLNPTKTGNPDGTWGEWSYLTTIGGTTSKFCTLNTTACRFWKAQN
jgi:hypothetical protein